MSRPSARDNILPKMIQTNKVAHGTSLEHTNRWHISDPDPSIGAFMSKIQGGDAIRIIPHARWPGWRNYILSARIEAHCRLASPPTHPPMQTAAAQGPVDGEATGHLPLYQPLDSERKEIRLLYIEPGKPQDPLRCRMITAALTSPGVPQFEALSYCWGSAANRTTLSVSIGGLDGQDAAATTTTVHTLSITASLAEALSHLRRQDGEGARLLWADAVCINQDDIPERGSQVGIMGQVYAKASAVVVWLGPSDAVTLEAVEFLKTIFQGYIRSTLTTKGHLPFADTLDAEEWNKVVYPKLIRVLSHFFNYPWFRRVWVVQELWLSQKAVICCGDETLTWESVMLANYWMNDAEGGGFAGISQEPLPSLWSSIAEKQNIASARSSSSPGCDATPSSRMKILDLVLDGLVLRATDPRDKIFALLGLGEETYRKSEMSHLLLPDYSKSTSQVYSDFTRWWINTYKSLAILSAVQATSRRTWQSLEYDQASTNSSTIASSSSSSDHPSWALAPSGNMRWATRTLGLHPRFRATGNTLAVPERNDPSKHAELVLEGELLGTVETIGVYPRYHVVEPDNESDRGDHELHQTFLYLFDPAGAVGVWSNAASLPRGTQEDTQSQRYQQMLLEHYIAHWHRLPRRDGTCRGFPCLLDCFFQAARSGKGGGKLIGLCPAGTREEDVVVLLHGGSVPYILRPTTGLNRDSERPMGTTTTTKTTYKFVGECYVKGEMWGEAFAARRNKGLATECFTLV